MHIGFFNMIVEPIYCAFANYNPTGNLLQFALVFMLIMTVIGWLKYCFS